MKYERAGGFKLEVCQGYGHWRLGGRKMKGKHISNDRAQNTLLWNTGCGDQLAERGWRNKFGTHFLFLGAGMDDVAGVSGRDQDRRQRQAASGMRRELTEPGLVAAGREAGATDGKESGAGKEGETISVPAREIRCRDVDAPGERAGKAGASEGMSRADGGAGAWSRFSRRRKARTDRRRCSGRN